MRINEKETQLLYIQMYASIILIITTITSTILTYNNIKKKEMGKSIFKNQLTNNITILNRIVITILIIIFTYINYEFYEISKIKNKSNLQSKELFASILTLISGFILLYTTTESIKEENQNINPNTPIF